jgi:hypothetical protein
MFYSDFHFELAMKIIPTGWFICVWKNHELWVININIK